MECQDFVSTEFCRPLDSSTVSECGQSTIDQASDMAAKRKVADSHNAPLSKKTRTGNVLVYSVHGTH